MQPSYIDQLVRQEQLKDLQCEAEQDRLARLAQSGQPIRPNIIYHLWTRGQRVFAPKARRQNTRRSSGLVL